MSQQFSKAVDLLCGFLSGPSQNSSANLGNLLKTFWSNSAELTKHGAAENKII
jgi:hypothetical protein